MKLPVYLYGHPVLRKVADDVDPTEESIKKLVDDMFETMYASEGVGLAAPQVGLSQRIVVIDADPVAEHFPECAGRRLVLINPDIEVLDGDKVTRSEGCLSLPGLSENVSRVEHIRLTWDDPQGNEHTEEISGFLARIVQHECDHLEGKMYIDHVSAIRRQLIRNKLNNIVEGRIRCDYPVKYAPKRKK
ncbi:MAG: peptide deformylase [Clostridiales bacterium]|nr:peptide deformylase [Clostridiales bacterium]